jgi:hypothetical protein
MQMNVPKGRALHVQKQFNYRRNLGHHLKRKIFLELRRRTACHFIKAETLQGGGETPQEHLNTLHSS